MTDPQRKRFIDRVVLVTGAASGIGQETALAFGADGAAVCCADVDFDGAKQTAERAGEFASATHLDVTDESQWETVIGKIVSTHGKLDVLVNCAGISTAGKVAETDFAEWRRTMAVNLDGIFLGTKHGIRAMGASGGSIVNVSSASAIKSAAGAAAYSTSKAAVCMLSRTAAKECRDAEMPIRVNTVCPGAVKTPIWNTMPFFRELVKKTGSTEQAFKSLAEGIPGGTFAEPMDIVKSIQFLASDEARFITGVDLPVDGGYIL
jgi:NAD(P)-dependent dehydrogenase (short-subunit alcohol dehydrogenase family)